MMTERSEPDHNDDGDQPEPTTEPDREAESFSSKMSALARSLQAENDPKEVLALLVQSAIDLVPGADEGSISVVKARKRVESQAASSDLPKDVDAVQGEVMQGPCLDAMFEHETVLVNDMASERRWPQFARRAADLGAASMLSFQLYVEADTLGALNLYGRSANGFTDESVEIGRLIASHAAVAYADTQKLEQLREVTQSRDIIGQAKGILMERYSITAQHAFIMLTQASSHTNIKLFDVADHLASTGALPSTRRRT